LLAFARARASTDLTIRACARRDRTRVNGTLRLLLFDIVNVQNWTALRATAPAFRDAQRKRRPFVHLGDFLATTFFAPEALKRCTRLDGP
jgi:hypothetical protein